MMRTTNQLSPFIVGALIAVAPMAGCSSQVNVEAEPLAITGSAVNTGTAVDDIDASSMSMEQISTPVTRATATPAPETPRKSGLGERDPNSVWLGTDGNGLCPSDDFVTDAGEFEHPSLGLVRLRSAGRDLGRIPGPMKTYTTTQRLTRRSV